MAVTCYNQNRVIMSSVIKGLKCNGKSKNRPLSHQRYFDKVLQKCSFRSPQPIVSLPYHLNLIGCLGNQKAKFGFGLSVRPFVTLFDACRIL